MAPEEGSEEIATLWRRIVVPCVGNKPPISVKVARKNSIMISLVLAEVPERESRKHLRYVEEKSLKTEPWALPP